MSKIDVEWRQLTKFGFPAWNLSFFVKNFKILKNPQTRSYEKVIDPTAGPLKRFCFQHAEKEYVTYGRWQAQK
jgi:hypothetical protein